MAGNLLLLLGSAWPGSWLGLILQEEEICVPLKLAGMILAVFFIKINSEEVAELIQLTVTSECILLAPH